MLFLAVIDRGHLSSCILLQHLMHAMIIQCVVISALFI